MTEVREEGGFNVSAYVSASYYNHGEGAQHGALVNRLCIF